MRTVKVFVGLAIAALVFALVLISLKAYYVLVAIVAGLLILGYRDIWSLITNRRIPPLDERLKENTGKAIRNGFIFFVVASIFLMLFLSVNQTVELELLHVLGVLFVATGLVYLLSYIFYDRAEPNLSERRVRMLKTFLIVAGIAVAVFVLSVFLHNMISGLFHIEEPVFFTIAIIIAPLGLLVGLIGSLVVFIIGLVGQR
jgi:cation transport ATPase